MPIARLIQGSRLPSVGELRKGAARTEDDIARKRPGKDLPYFRFTSDYPDVAAKFLETYTDKPATIWNLYLPHKTTDENFDCWQEEWVAGGLIHRCDGVTCSVWRDKDGHYQQTAKPCPGGCKPIGRLAAIAPALGHLATITIMTSSIHDIANLQRQLRALEIMHGSLQGIPLSLRRASHRISVPGQNGQPRSRMAKSLLTIEAMPQWFELKLAEIEAAARPDVPMLTAGKPDEGSNVIFTGTAPAANFGTAPDEEAEDGDYQEIDPETGEILDRPAEPPEAHGEPQNEPVAATEPAEARLAAVRELVALSKARRIVYKIDEMTTDEILTTIRGLKGAGA